MFKIAPGELTDACLLVAGHDAARWTDVTLQIRIDTPVTVTDSGVRSAHGYNTRQQTVYSVIIITIISVIIIIITCAPYYTDCVKQVLFSMCLFVCLSAKKN